MNSVPQNVPAMPDSTACTYLPHHTSRYFRLYRVPKDYEMVRIAAGSDGSVWLVVALSEAARLRTTGPTLAGVHRGFAAKPGQAPPPNWPKTCADADPGCADGGCDAALTRCLRCAGPKFVMGSNGKVGDGMLVVISCMC